MSINESLANHVRALNEVNDSAVKNEDNFQCLLRIDKQYRSEVSERIKATSWAPPKVLRGRDL